MKNNNNNNVLTNNYSNKNSKLELHNNYRNNNSNNSNIVKNVNSTTTSSNGSVAFAGCLMPNTSSSSSSVHSSSTTTDSSPSTTALASVRSVGPSAPMLLLPKGGNSGNSNSSGYHSSNAVTAAAIMTAKLAKAGSFLSVVPPAIPSSIAIGGINRIGGGGSDRAFVLGSQTYATSHLTAASVLASAVAAAAAAANVVHHQQQRSNYTTASLSRHLTKNLTSNASSLSKKGQVSTGEGKSLLSKISSASQPSAAVSISNSETITNVDTSTNPACPVAGMVEANPVPPVVRTLVATVGATNTIATLASPVPSAVLLTTSSSVNSNHCYHPPLAIGTDSPSTASSSSSTSSSSLSSTVVIPKMLSSQTQSNEHDIISNVTNEETITEGTAKIVEIFANAASKDVTTDCEPQSPFGFRDLLKHKLSHTEDVQAAGSHDDELRPPPAIKLRLQEPIDYEEAVGLVGQPITMTMKGNNEVDGGEQTVESQGEKADVHSIVNPLGEEYLANGSANGQMLLHVGKCEKFTV
ncbi:uncharacterized protein DDB_G0271670-like [Anopheles albimanus]|uniref:uncharacterized protein DDB_G0271670-like n=1 Tax=Anopheles albimanus TaxID=7167 RepID=UPI0016412086|nr:uncharacterized protein DDB_G0271670-like [Anopheles albimanus]